MKIHLLLRALAISTAMVVAALAPDAAQSQSSFRFGWSAGSNIIYRLDKKTGEVKACEFASAECAVPGEGAVPENPGDYEIVAPTEGEGVIRLNKTDPEEPNKLCSSVAGRLCCCPGSKVCNANRVCVNPPP